MNPPVGILRTEINLWPKWTTRWVTLTRLNTLFTFWGNSIYRLKPLFYELYKGDQL